MAIFLDGITGGGGEPISTGRVNTQPKRVPPNSIFALLTRPVNFGSRPRPNYRGSSRPNRGTTRPKPAYDNNRIEIIDTNGPGLPFDKPFRDTSPSPQPPSPPPPPISSPPSPPGHGTKVVVVTRPPSRPPPVFNTNPTRPKITLPPIYRRKNYGRPYYDDDSIRLRNLPNKEDPVEALGISKERPEILAITDYNPLEKQKVPNAYGKFADLQFDARTLKTEKLKDLMVSLENTPSIAPTLEVLKERYIENIVELDKQVAFLQSAVRLLEKSEEILDIKNIFRVQTRSTEFGNSSKNMREIMIETFGFSGTQLNKFSSTKLLGQFFKDYATVLMQYSPNLLDESIEDRETTSLIASHYHRDLDVANGSFFFSLEDFRSPMPELLSMGDSGEFRKFVKALPFAPEERIKVLSAVLSKELRYSVAINNSATSRQISNEFGYYQYRDSKHPIDTMVGASSVSVTDYITDSDSLLSLTQIHTDKDVVVLPFEQAIIKGVKNRVFLSGKEYLVDSILEKGSDLNTKKFQAFADRFDRKIKAQDAIVTQMLNLGDTKRTLFTDFLFDKICASISNVSALAPGTRTINTDYMVPFALFNLADKDEKLKRQLYQYTVLAGLKGGQNRTNPFFSRLAKGEFERVSSLSEIGYSNNVNQNEFLGNSSEFKDMPGSSDSGTPRSGRAGIPWGKFLENVQITGRSSLRNGYVVDVCADILSQLIADRVLEILGTGQRFKLENTTRLLSKFQLRTIIKNQLAIYREIARLTDFVENEIAKLPTSNNGRYWTYEGFATSCSKISGSAIFAMIFELASSMYNRCLDANLIASNKRGSVYIKVNASYNQAIGKFFSEMSTATPKNMQTLDNSYLPNSWPGGKTVPLRFKNFDKFIEYAWRAHHDSSFPLEVPWSPKDSREFGRIEDLYTSMRSIKLKMLQEDYVMLDIVEGLAPLANHFNNYADDLKRFFDKDTGRNTQRLKALEVQLADGKTASMIKKGQINLAINDLINIKSSTAITSESSSQRVNQAYYPGKTPKDAGKGAPANEKQYPVFFDETIIPPRAVSFFRDYFSQNTHVSAYGQDAKIITVGIPAGFSDKLVPLTDLPTYYRQVSRHQNDVIEINIHKKDINFESIVFKPKKYVFEMDRFISRAAFVEADDQAITAAAKGIEEFADIFSTKLTFKSAGRLGKLTNSILQNKEYDFLSLSQKKQLVINHLHDYLLQIYLQIFTGVSYEEKTFPVETVQGADRFSDETKAVFKRMIEQYSSDLVGRPVTIEDMKAASRELSILLNKIDRVVNSQNANGGLTVPSLPNADLGSSLELTEDLQSFVKAFKPGSLFTGGDALRNRILTPKAFDRVFNFFVNPNDFVIDIAKTKSTKSGQIELDGVLQAGLTNESNFGEIRFNKKIGSKKEVSFDQFFVTIETIGPTTA